MRATRVLLLALCLPRLVSAARFGVAARSRAMAAIRNELATEPLVSTAVAMLRELASVAGHQRPLSGWHGYERHKWPGLDHRSTLVPAAVDDIMQHLHESERSVHPADRPCGGEQRDLVEAVRSALSWGRDSQSRRDAVWHRVDKVQRALRPCTERCYAHMPKHIMGMPEPHPHVAFVHCCVVAMEWCDVRLLDDLCCGAPVCGHSPDSGVFREKRRPAVRPLQCADGAVSGKDGYTERLMALVKPYPPDGDLEAAELWDATMKEVLPAPIQGVPPERQGKAKLPYTLGPFSKEQLDATYGAGCWWPMRRFAVTQKGAIRPCDNAAASGHNDASSFDETIVCEAPDFGMRIAHLFVTMASAPLRWTLAGGTDDMEKAYRKMPVDDPSLTVICQWDPFNARPVFFQVQGFPFGLATAVNGFNRLTAFLTAFHRRILRAPCSNYYDDFVVVDWVFSAAATQRVMGLAMLAFGFPFSAAKHVVAASEFTFLGVTCSFASLLASSTIELFVRPERVRELRNDIGAAMRRGYICGGAAAKLAGKLMFTVTWADSRFGKAVIQPVIVAALYDTVPMVGALVLALRFFYWALGRLPRRKSRIAARPERPVRIWTDAAYEPDDVHSAAMGFVAFLPGRDSLPDRWIHGSTVVPRAFVVTHFGHFKQYIGQLEMLAAVAVYASLDPADLRGRRVIHWIDNTGALAAMVKGYARALRGTRLVHAFASLALDLQVNVWFEYVRSKANIADLPSREFLPEYDAFEQTAPARAIGSQRVVMVVPPLEEWAKPFAEWTTAAYAGLVRNKPGARKRARRGKKGA